jgi:hypothetical protein
MPVTRRTFNQRHRSAAGTRNHLSSSFGVPYEPTTPYESDPQNAVDPGGGTVDEGNIIPGGLNGDAVLTPGTVSLTPFADTIRPIALVDALPTLPDFLYPPGAFVYKTNDTPPRLYKNVADAWVAAIGPNDIQANSITAGQIAAGTLTATEIATGTLTADKMMVGQTATRNLLTNGGFRRGTEGWLLDGVGPVPGLLLTMYSESDSQWTLRDGDVDGWDGTGAPYGSTAFMYGTNTASTFYPATYQFVPVIGGEWYSLSGFLGTHRLTAARLEVFWYDDAGSDLGGTGYFSALDMAKQGGAWISGWNEVTGTLQAPTNATKAKFKIVAQTPNTSGTDWYLFMDRMWFGLGKYPQRYDANEVSNLSNADGNVTIGSDGITIRNGKLTLQDEYGLTVMRASGFAGSWGQFVATSLYNSSFASGSTGALADGTSGLPYWTVSRTGSPTITRSADATYPSGYRLRVAFSAINDSVEVLSAPVPVVPGMPYGFGFVGGYNKVGDSEQLDIDLSVYWLNSSLAAVGSPTTFGGAITPGFGAGTAGTLGATTSGTGSLTATAPVTAAYMQVRLRAKETLAHNAGNYLDLGAAMAQLVPLALDGAGMYTVESLGATATIDADQLVAYSLLNVGDVDITTPGSGSLLVSGYLRASGGLATLSKAGTISDTDFAVTPVNGALGVDITNHRIYFREGGSWHYVVRTAGFEVPAHERVCPALGCGQPLLPDDAMVGKGDREREDGALHGLWVHLRCADRPLDRQVADKYESI